MEQWLPQLFPGPQWKKQHELALDDLVYALATGEVSGAGVCAKLNLERQKYIVRNYDRDGRCRKCRVFAQLLRKLNQEFQNIEHL